MEDNMLINIKIKDIFNCSKEHFDRVSYKNYRVKIK